MKSSYWDQCYMSFHRPFIIQNAPLIYFTRSCLTSFLKQIKEGSLWRCLKRGYHSKTIHHLLGRKACSFCDVITFSLPHGWQTPMSKPKTTEFKRSPCLAQWQHQLAMLSSTILEIWSVHFMSIWLWTQMDHLTPNSVLYAYPPKVLMQWRSVDLTVNLTELQINSDGMRACTT